MWTFEPSEILCLFLERPATIIDIANNNYILMFFKLQSLSIVEKPTNDNFVFGTMYVIIYVTDAFMR